MQLHANAKLGPSGRYALVAAIEGGRSLRAAAAAFNARRRRHIAGGAGGWLADMRRPHSTIARVDLATARDS
jgi:hypothetical protein